MELFADSYIFLYAAAVIAALCALWYLGALRQRAAINALFSRENFLRLIPQGLAPRRRLADILFLTGLFFLFIALASPQWGRERVSMQASYSQIVVAVDVSNSMLAEDFKPNRLESAKMMLSMLLENIGSERVGLMAFTSKPYLQAPITTDIYALKNIAAVLNTNFPEQGTALAPPLSLAVKMLEPYPGTKAFVLITDGEDHHPQDIQNALNLARENNIRVIAVGIGTPDGELIPVRDGHGGKTYKKDSEGKTVITKLDEKALMSFAQATGGVYIRYTTPQNTADEIMAQIAALDKSSVQTNLRNTYKNRYQIPLSAGLLLLLASILIPLRKVE